MKRFFKKIFNRNDQEFIFKEYGYEVFTFNLSEFGEIQYAEWQHPYSKLKEMSDDKVEFYRFFTSEGSTVIDIGAHTGDTTVPMALAVGSLGLTIAIEPNKYVYPVLEKNSTLNTEFTNIKPFCFAAAKEEGTLTFNYSDASFCNGGYLSQIHKKRHNHYYELEVTGKNLEHFLNENFSEYLPKLELIKIDAEGYDKEILKTIPNILNDFKPNLLAECYKRLDKEERDELFDILDNHGYILFRLDDLEGINNFIKLEKENMSDEKHFEMAAIHNTNEALLKKITNT